MGEANAPKQHFLMQINPQSFQQNLPINHNPIVAQYEVPAPVQQAVWANPSTLATVLGDENGSRVQLYHAGRNGLSTNFENPVCSFAGDVRDVAVNNNNFLIADNAMNLHLVDLNRPGPTQMINIGTDVSSVKWNAGFLPTCTTDSGKLLMFDFRSGITPIREIPSLHHACVFGHEWYTQTNVILGYRGGGMLELDTRMLPLPNATRGNGFEIQDDPFVDNVGDIEYHPASGLFAVSGSTDFSVYKHEQDTATLWSHSLGTKNPLTNEKDVHTFASFYDGDTVISTSTDGAMGVYLQGAH